MADRAFMLWNRCFLVLALNGAAIGAAALGGPAVSQADLLRRMIDLDRLTAPVPAGERCGTVSDCGVSGEKTKPGGLPSEGEWAVLADLRGPGAVTRLWLAQPDGDLKLVLDGETVLEAPVAEVLGGQMEPLVGPMLAGRCECSFPMGFAASCKVLRKGGSAGYRIRFVQFAPGTAVQRFSRELDEPAQAALAEVRTALTRGLTESQAFGGRRTMPVGEQKDLGPGDVLSWKLDGAGTVRALYVGLTDRSNPRALYALHRCVIRVYVDGQEQPNIEAPLIDFFGSGFDVVNFGCLAMGTNRALKLPLPDRPFGEDHYFYCLLPMPYRDSLRVDIQNLNEDKKSIGLLLHMRVDRKPPDEKSLRFFARYRREDPIRGGQFRLWEVVGPARLVGWTLNIDCPRPLAGGQLALESLSGQQAVGQCVGSLAAELPGSGRWDGTPSLGPWGGISRTGDWGKRSACRWYLGDSLDFPGAARMRLAASPAEALGDAYVGAVAYWYAAAGTSHSFPPLTRADLRPRDLTIPGAVEIEGQVSGTDWGREVKQDQYEGVEFSGEYAASISTTQPVRIVIPSRSARTVQLKLRTNPLRSFGQVVVSEQDGRAIGTVEYNPGADGVYDVGRLVLAAGNNVLQVQCSRPVMLDCWILENVVE